MIDGTDGERIRHMITYLEAEAIGRGKLTKWEEDFIESIKEQFRNRGFLSERQMEVLTKIFEEKA